MSDGELRAEVDRLAGDPITARQRAELCEDLAMALAEFGKSLWVGGVMIGSDRRDGISPFGFGDDRTVGVAMIAQIAGELARGTISLLTNENRYAAQALIRQIVEVEYLAYHFADEDDDSGPIAAAWLRANRQQRLDFWQPRHLRARADGRFPTSDYQHHCDLGGHPTTAAMSLLPDHSRDIPAQYIWVDLAGHLVRIWEYIFAAGAQLPLASALDNANWSDTAQKIERWRDTDDLYQVVQTLGAILRMEEPQKEEL